MEETAARCGLSIIVVNWNTRGLLRRCLASIEETARGLDVETLVVDNASSDGSAEMTEAEFPNVRLVRQTANLGFARAVNAAVPDARGRLVLLLNPDTVVLPGTLSGCVGRMAGDGGIDVLGCRLVGEDGDMQTSCGVFPGLRTLFWQNLFVAVLRILGPRPLGFLSRTSGVPLMPLRALRDLWDPGQTREVDWVSGAFLLTRRSVWDRVGPLDETFWLFGEDLDWCRRVRQSGGRVIYFGEAQIVHVGGASSRGSVESDLRHYRASVRLYVKHHGRARAWVYRGVLGAAALVRLFGLVLARLVGRGGRQFRTRLTREWGILRLRS